MKRLLIDDAADHITKAAVDGSATNIVPGGSILVVTRSGILSHTLPVAKVMRPVAINQDIKALVPERHYDSDFVLHALRAYEYRILQECGKSGTTVANLDTDRFLNFRILIPTYKEQREIVAKLERLFERSKNSREELTLIPRLVGRYKQAILNAAFAGDLTVDWRAKASAQPKSSLLSDLGAKRSAYCRKVRIHEKPALSRSWTPSLDLPEGWEFASVDQLAVLVQYGSSAKTSESLTNGVPVLRMGNIFEGRLDYTKLKYLPRSHYEFPDLLLQDGDVLFNRTNSAELVGKTAVYSDSGHRTSFASYLIRLRIVGYLPELLSAYINSEFGRQWVRSVVNQQVGQANVNGTKLRGLGVPLMPPDEQKEIWSQINAAFSRIDRLEKEATRATELLDRLDQATLAKAFRGELVRPRKLAKPMPSVKGRRQ
jgi:type I restriction enzyme S subunit